VTTPEPTPEPTTLGRLLLESRDTVTQLLQSITGEPLVAEVISQTARPPGQGDLSGVGVGVGEPVVERIALLKGRASATPYVYAESVYPPAGLPEPVRRHLAETDHPIGRVLLDHGLRLHRHDIPTPPDGPPAPLDAMAAASGAVAWWRSYLLVVDDAPVFFIREWFFRSVVDAMGPHP
jgi:chorismate-pyruvate lyase